ncbi:MAG: 30S ribosomal protein S16 [Candidatus Krumholzibacteriia bacterium]
MATAIRFARMGKKKRPFYRLVAVDSRKRRDGAYLANLGFYNPFVEPYELQLHDEEIMVWLKRGAVVSETVRSLLKSQGLMLRFALEKQGLPAEDVAAKVAEFRAGAGARAQERADSAAQRKSAQVAEAARVKAAAVAAKAAEAAAAAAAEQAAAQAAAAEQAAGEAAPEGDGAA